MTANISMKFVSDTKDYFMVPLAALNIDSKGAYSAWVVDPKTLIVRRVTVQVGPIINNLLQVRSGLNAGDMIVAAGVSYLQDGMKVTLIKGRIGRDDD